MANVISGPCAGMLLADLGADVVKVEMPRGGDVFRVWGGDNHVVSPPFAAFNRDKRSITIDVKTEAGVDCFLRLVRTADVVLENFRPGVLDRLGVGYEQIAEVNPSVIYCAISGMGRTGPESHRPTYDAVAQALSGLWSQFTDLDDPEPVGPALCDQLAGMYAAYGVLGALVGRASTGQGQRLDVSMLGAGLSFQSIAVAGWLIGGVGADKSARAHRSQTYSFNDAQGLPFAIHLSTPDKFWRGLATAVERLDLLTDPRFVDKRSRIANYDVLRDELRSVFRTGERADWLARLAAQDVPCAPINTIGEALDEPQVRHLGVVQTFGTGDGAVELAGSPVDFAGHAPGPRSGVPRIGEHTDELLIEVGLSPEEIEDLRLKSAI